MATVEATERSTTGAEELVRLLLACHDELRATLRELDNGMLVCARSRAQNADARLTELAAVLLPAIAVVMTEPDQTVDQKMAEYDAEDTPEPPDHDGQCPHGYYPHEECDLCYRDTWGYFPSQAMRSGPASEHPAHLHGPY